MANLMDFGVAVNFFGNYARESREIQSVSEKIYSGFNRLKHVMIGAGITTALYKFGHSLAHTSMELEGVYATLLTVFGSKNRVLEHFREAREFVAKNPILDLEQIHHATEQLALAGQAKTGKQTNANLQYLGDFAMGKGMDISTAIQAAVNAGNGNWEMLRNRGFDNRNLKTTALNAHGTFTDEDGKTKEKSTELLKLADALNKAKVGTDEYKATVIKFLGIYEAGGMENASKTITGAMRAGTNLIKIFKMEIVGMTQSAGSLSHTIGETLGKAVGKFSAKMHKIENIGRGVGEILKGVWGFIDTAIESSSNTILAWIDNLNEFFSDYKNNIAPIILFLYLIKLEVMEFVSGFVEGFKWAFGSFLIAIKYIYIAFATLIKWFGGSENASKNLGRAVGLLVGTMLGLKAIRFATQPFAPLISGAGTTLKFLDKLIFKQRMYNGLQRIMNGNLDSGMTLIKGGFSRLAGTIMSAVAPMGGMATASWAFTASLLANPITWIVVAVIALVAWIAYLIYNWDEVQKKMQGVSDIALVMLSVFMPIIGIPLLMAKYWKQLTSIVRNVWRGITGYAKAFWLYLKFEFLIPMGNFFSKIWNGIKNTVVGVWNWITAKATGFFNYILTKFPFLMVFVNAFKTAWQGVKDLFSGIWDFFVKIYDKVMNSDFVGAIMDMADSVSNLFGDAGEDAYKEKLKKYDPEAYEKEFGKKTKDAYTKPVTGGGTTTTSTVGVGEQNSIGTINVYGNPDPNAFTKKMTEQVKKTGKK